MPRPTPPPSQHQNQLSAAAQQSALVANNTLADLDIDQLPDHFKKEGTDWFAVFNPRTRRVLDVDLIHNLPHQSVVCCVRFSIDGRFVATGCNRSAQIFEVASGNLVAHLQDGSLPEDGDLYIRSVCFSPDGTYLATGAEDKVIRVRSTAYLDNGGCFAYSDIKTLIAITEFSLGLGDCEPYDQTPVYWPRPGHLLVGFRP